VTDVIIDGATGQVSASLSMLKRDLIGYQAGADVRYWLTSHIGAGGYARISAAKGNLGPAVKADLGGPQFGAGVRLRF
jgi:hypothetical protein